MTTQAYPNVEYDKGIADGPGEMASLVGSATAYLAKIMGDHFPDARVTWSGPDPTICRPDEYSLNVEMPAWEEASRYTFTPQELHDRHHVHYQLHQLWGDILRGYNHRLVKRMAVSGGG